MNDETAYWVALSRVAGIGPVRTRALLDFFGSAEGAWLASGANLQMAGLDTRAADNLLLLPATDDIVDRVFAAAKASNRTLTHDQVQIIVDEARRMPVKG